MMLNLTRSPRRAARRALLAAALTLAAAAPCMAAAQAARPAAPAAATPARDASADAVIARADRGRIRGRQNTVWIVVISDFQCPFCKRWHEEVEPRITQEYVATGKAQIAYINYPLASIHPNAYATHEVAMCAAEQERFWPVADALFDSQDRWKNRRDIAAFLDSMVARLPVDKPRLDRCVKDGTLRALIDADVDRSKSLGVGSTPSFLIGGRPMIGAQPYEAFKAAIDAALAAQATPGAPAAPGRAGGTTPPRPAP